MPEQRETGFYESGRATAPPGICYSSLAGSTGEEYTHTSVIIPASTNFSDFNRTETIQSPHYTPNYLNYTQQKVLDSPHYTPSYSPCPSPSQNYSSTVSKTNSPNLPFQSPQCTSNYSTSHTYLPTFSSSNFVSCNNSNTSFNNNFEFPSASRNSPKNNSSFTNQENTTFQSSDHSSGLFNYPKIPKCSSVATPKYTSNYSNFSYFSNNQPRYSQTKESADSCSEKNVKFKRDIEVAQKSLKSCKDDIELSYNFEELQQFLSKHGTKIKNTSENNQDLVTDSLLHLLQKKTQEKNPQDNTIPYDLGDVSQLLVSLTSKYKTEETSGLKKKESCEDSKLMNDFLTKIILEKEEKRFKTFDDKKRNFRKEIFDDLNIELDEKKIKRDAMSHYQEEKTHHKRSSNYGEFNQWDYLNQQDVQIPNNHNRRGHFSFGGTSQPHSVGWSPMGMGMARQTNPYYSNPHGHMLPAHAHSEYRYNQWNNPNHKSIPNVHNAHSQNTLLSQTRMDIKHHQDVSNSVQDFGVPIGPTSDLAKLGTPRDICIRNPTSEKSTRSAIHPDHLASISPAIRNPSTLRTPPLPSHPKPVINNPLSDLQMLVTNQDTEHSSQKSDNYQQESVDLSAHSDPSKQKENLVREEDKTLKDNNSERKNFKSPATIIQTHNKQINSDFNEVFEKPVELTSKNIEKSAKTESESLISVNNVEKKCPNAEILVDNLKENNKTEVIKSVENITENLKPQVINEKNENSCVNNSKDEVLISNNIHNNETDNSSRSETKEEESSKKEESGSTVVKDLNKDQREAELSKGQNSKTQDRSSNEALIASNQECENNSQSFKNSKRKTGSKGSDVIDCESKKACLEVESRLEKMFEGVGNENAELPTVSSTSAENKPALSESNKKTPKKKPSRRSRGVRLSSGQSSSSESRFHGKKSKGFSNKDDNKKKMKKNLCDVMDRRGPFLHLEGSKESPTSVIVINFPKGDDEDEKDKNSIKKISSNSSRTKRQNELDYRGTSRNGLFSSTLSSRYDAHTTDHTWVCVFCKKGPHYNKLGDLFGPYIISEDEKNSLCDFSGDEKDISDAQKRGGRNKKSLRSNNMVEHFQKMSRKLRRTQSNESCLKGMTVISDDQVDQLRYEVWVHEQCTVWSPNVCLIGSRIVGMQEAIWSSVKTMCSKCGAFGANVGCVYRNCPNRSHYHCAKESGWSLEQETFISTCHIHKQRS